MTSTATRVALVLGTLVFSRSPRSSSSLSLPWFLSRPHCRLTSSCTSPGSLSASSTLSISDSFDGGNIEFVGLEESESHDEPGERQGEGTHRVPTLIARLRIKPDVYSDFERTAHSQYFCFRSTLLPLSPEEEDGSETTGTEKTTTTVRYVIENADQVSYPRAWNGSTVFVSTSLGDPSGWRRALDTAYSPESGHLTWTVRHPSSGRGGIPVIYCCYFPPFSYQDHLYLLAESAPHAKRIESLGQTLDARDVDCVVAGTGPLACWVIHRQHPGEPMASYFARGLLRRLLGTTTGGEVDGQVSKVLLAFTFYVVPLMCPDGAVRGHLRTNGVGANLNREWATVREDYPAPSLIHSPEVYGVLRRMDETGVDAFVDVHGDEELPFNFLSGSEGTLHWGPRLAALHGAFTAAYCRANSDMQSRVGYLPPPPGRRASPNIATNAVAERFDCLSVTLEMPFKDCLSNPNPAIGWSPNRAGMLGASLVDALAYVHPYLRAPGEFWNRFPLEDAYVPPTRTYSY